MILLAFIPAIIWAFSPVWFRPWMKVFATLCLIVAVVLFVRRLYIGWRATRDGPARAAWQWREGWSTTAFRQHLINHLEEGGWSLLSSAFPDEHRVELACERGRDRFVLLCIRPGAAATLADNDRLAAAQARYDAATALLADSPAGYAALADPDRIGAARLL